jgi:hypothetical protein
MGLKCIRAKEQCFPLFALVACTDPVAGHRKDGQTVWVTVVTASFCRPKPSEEALGGWLAASAQGDDLKRHDIG